MKQPGVLQCEFKYSHSRSLFIKTVTCPSYVLHLNGWCVSTFYCCCHTESFTCSLDLLFRLEISIGSCRTNTTPSFSGSGQLGSFPWIWIPSFRNWTFNSDSDWLNRGARWNSRNELLKGREKETGFTTKEAWEESSQELKILKRRNGSRWKTS